MRLLTSDEPHFGGTIVLKEYIGSQIPPYAILSHRWTDDEISYEDMSKGWSTLPAAGRDKIEKFCRLAGFNGYSHAWVDTCCIDKRSSAELTESINSMYNWYGEAAICYAYLNDVPDNEEVVQDPVFARSVWFTRGWTLQELIAPSRVIFFSNGWNEIGEKHTLARRLAQITDIDVHVLGGAKHPYECSVAQRMAWAANRVTTRREDIAYSLLGLFDVNMPLLYGEGEKAFIRLQEEIVRISDDDSLFAWKDETASPMDCHGLLANSPKHFRESRHIWCPASRMDRQPYTITNRGIRIWFSIRPATPAELGQQLGKEEGQGLYVAALHCRSSAMQNTATCIFIKQMTNPVSSFSPEISSSWWKDNEVSFQRINERMISETWQFVRIRLDYLPVFQWYPRLPRSLCVLQNIRNFKSDVLQIAALVHSVSYATYTFVDTTGVVTASLPLPWHKTKGNGSRVYSLSKATKQLSATMIFKRRDESRLAVLLGSTTDTDVALNVISDYKDEDFEMMNEVFTRTDATLGEIHTDLEKIHLDVETRIFLEQKYVLVEVSIERLPQERESGHDTPATPKHQFGKSLANMFAWK